MNRFQLNLLRISVLFTVIFFSSCAPRVIFTEGARVRLAEQNVDMSKIQFYNDKEVILRRKVDSSEFTVDSGVIREVDGRRTQEIKIPRYTPCIIEGYDNGKLFLRFERGDEKLLRFKRNAYESFQIDADDWINRQGAIEYGGKDFYIQPGGNDALLLVKKTKAYKSMTESRVTPGIKVKSRRKKGKKKSRRQRQIDDLKKDPNAPKDGDDGASDVWE
ncbi:MAG: hypothetical protein AAGN35_14500 [Bacteroidota bacterium]